MIYCNNKKCEYNLHGERCSRETIYYVDRLCMTFHRMPGIDRLMQPSFRSGCRKAGGRYKSDNGKTLK